MSGAQIGISGNVDNLFYPKVQFELSHFPEPVQTDQSMSVIIRSLGGIDISMGSELGCITPSGYVGGALNLDDINDGQWGMAIWGDDNQTEEIDGFRDGERLRFLYWDAKHDWELNLSLEVIDGEDVFYNNSFLAIDIAVSVPENIIVQPHEFGIIKLYPNPFNNMLIISYSLPVSDFTEISIYDMTGKKQHYLFSGHNRSGMHQLSYSNSTLPSGNYFIELKQNKYSFQRKVTLLK